MELLLDCPVVDPVGDFTPFLAIEMLLTSFDHFLGTGSTVDHVAVEEDIVTEADVVWIPVEVFRPAF